MKEYLEADLREETSKQPQTSYWIYLILEIRTVNINFKIINMENIKEAIELLEKSKEKLTEAYVDYPWKNNIEYEMYENISRYSKLISEMKTLLIIFK